VVTVRHRNFETNTLYLTCSIISENITTYGKDVGNTKSMSLIFSTILLLRETFLHKFSNIKKCHETPFLVLKFIIHMGRWSWVVILTSSTGLQTQDIIQHVVWGKDQLSFHWEGASCLLKQVHKHSGNMTCLTGALHIQNWLIHVSGIWTLGPAAKCFESPHIAVTCLTRQDSWSSVWHNMHLSVQGGLCTG
jgi:hypothetical protein